MLRNLLTIPVLAVMSLLPAATAWADGAVYAMTNALDNNQVLVYHRAANGNLNLIQTIATGGGWHRRRSSDDIAGPRTGAAQLLRLCLRQERQPPGDRAVRFGHEHPQGRRGRNIVIRHHQQGKSADDQLACRGWRDRGVLDRARADRR